MKINLMNINEHEFAALQGTVLVTEENKAGVQALMYPEHANMDVAPVPFWATSVQEILERQCVVYSKEEIEAGKFLGSRIQAIDETVEVSLGQVGEKEALVSITFQKDFNATGEPVLGGIIRVQNIEHVA